MAMLQFLQWDNIERGLFAVIWHALGSIALSDCVYLTSEYDVSFDWWLIHNVRSHQEYTVRATSSGGRWPQVRSALLDAQLSFTFLWCSLTGMCSRSMVSYVYWVLKKLDMWYMSSLTSCWGCRACEQFRMSKCFKVCWCCGCIACT